MRLKYYSLLLVLMAGMQAQAQRLKKYSITDSVRYDLKQPSRFVLGFDGRNSFISDAPIKMYGIRGGWEYNGRTSLLIGLYNTADRFGHNDSTINKSGKTDVYKSSVGLGYISGIGEYMFYSDKKWELSIPVQLGLGAGRRQYYRNDSLIHSESPFVMPLELGFNASYKLTWWCGFGAGIGLRFSLVNTSEFNGAYYNFGFQIYTGAMYRRWFKKKKS